MHLTYFLYFVEEVIGETNILPSSLTPVNSISSYNGGSEADSFDQSPKIFGFNKSSVSNDEVIAQVDGYFLLKSQNSFVFSTKNAPVIPHNSSSVPTAFDRYANQKVPFDLSNSTSWEASYMFNNEEYSMSFTPEELLFMKFSHKISHDVDMDPCKSGMFLK